MSGEEPVVDVRGNTCPGPALTVEEFIQTKAQRQPFTVLGDHLPTLESLPLLAARHGWTCEFEQDPSSGDWKARFRPSP